MAPQESTKIADGRVGRRIENYAQFWQKDLSKEAAQDSENRLDSYVDVVNGESRPSVLFVMSFPLLRCRGA